MGRFKGFLVQSRAFAGHSQLWYGHSVAVPIGSAATRDFEVSQAPRKWGIKVR